MNALLRAYANSWRQAGAPDLAELVSAIDAPENMLSPEDQVPDALKPEYDQAVNSLVAYPELKQQLLNIGNRLPWMQGSMRMPASFQGRFAYVELAGPRGMIANSDVSFGFYLQQRDTVYPSHWHEAVEDYLIVSGTALWQIDDAGFNARQPGTHIMHASNQPHATTTLQEPLLAMWFWRGDIRDSTYRVVGLDT